MGRQKSAILQHALARLAAGNFVLPSPEDVRAAGANGNGWSYMQLAEWGVPIPPPTGWRDALKRKWQEANGHLVADAGCGVCGAQDAPVLITRGVNRDGTLRTFLFCGDPHKSQWQAANPLSSPPPTLPARSPPVIAVPRNRCAVCKAPAAYRMVDDPWAFYCSPQHLGERVATVVVADIPF